VNFQLLFSAMTDHATPSTAKTESQATIRIRSMRVADLPAVHYLEVISQPVPWRQLFFRIQLRKGASCWVLETDNEIIGFGIVSFVKDWAHIINMCVAPGYRRRGLGRRIMLHLLRVARQRHCRRAWLEVRPTNLPAISLYRKLGFRLRQIRKGYYITPKGRQHALVMVRSLRPSTGGRK
jgi:ribosomal-protein-alanine N-acetyltransferase